MPRSSWPIEADSVFCSVFPFKQENIKLSGSGMWGELREEKEYNQNILYEISQKNKIKQGNYEVRSCCEGEIQCTYV